MLSHHFSFAVFLSLSVVSLQGVFLKRHRIPKSAAEFFTIDDLRIGADLIVYGRPLHVYDCDPFSRAFFESLAVRGRTSRPDQSETLLITLRGSWRCALKSSLDHFHGCIVCSTVRLHL